MCVFTYHCQRANENHSASWLFFINTFRYQPLASSSLRENFSSKNTVINIFGAAVSTAHKVDLIVMRHMRA